MMQADMQIGAQVYRVDLDKPIQLAQPLAEGSGSSRCFYAPPFEVFPVVAGSFIGSTAEGGAVNFMNVRLNPHGNGTHTECVGHISREPYYLPDCLQRFHFSARLVSIYPERQDNGDKVITAAQLRSAWQPGETEALIVRTLPNGADKLLRQYSGINPPYFEAEGLRWLTEHGINHLLTDLPSVDREEDGGQLLGHKAFWNYPEKPALERTITELIYADPGVADGYYLLNIQIAQMILDACPSSITIYKAVLQH